MNKIFFILLLCLVSSLAFSQDGRVLKVLGADDAFIMRSGQKLKIEAETEIFTGDEIFSENAVLLLHIFPSTQLSMTKNSQIKIDENTIEDDGKLEKSNSIIGFLKGIIRLNVSKDTNEEINQKVQSEGVAFAVRGTDYELSMDNNEVDLDVHEGSVEVSSPYVQTFVPQIVKGGGGFRFNRKQKNFASRSFGPKFKNHPAFIQKQELRARWKKDKEIRKGMRAQKKIDRSLRKTERQEKREQRKNRR